MSQMFCIYADCDYDGAELVGYVEDEGVAQQICIQHNKNMTGNDRSWDYDSLDKLEAPTKTLKLVFVHEVLFDLSASGKYEMWNEPSRYSYFEKGDSRIPPSSSVVQPISPTAGKWLAVTIVTRLNDRKKAEAKARTLLKEFLRDNNQK